MRSILVFAILAAMATLTAGTALAENIAGRIGITGRIGFTVPADSDYGIAKVETDAGIIGGGGFIYGIDRNIAAEIDVTRSAFRSNDPLGTKTGDFGITDIALGAQYRFSLTQPHLTPYVGAGLDILLSDFDPSFGNDIFQNHKVRHDVDTTVGVHACGGIDYFVLKNLALNAEARVVVAPETDINDISGKRGNFDPSSFSGLFGVRFFFN